MKQGSADDPFADETENDTSDSDQQPDSELGSASDQERNRGLERTSKRTTQRQSLPYIHARDGVKDGRTQRPVFLREHIEDGIDELVDRMEDEFGEDVYKTDVTEAAMSVAQENPELVLAKLEEWGYGWS